MAHLLSSMQDNFFGVAARLFGRNALHLKASCCERNTHRGGNNERT